MKLKSLLFFISLLFSSVVSAQGTSGKEFWMAFIQNADKDMDYEYHLRLSLSASESTEVTVENEKIGYKKTISLGNNSVENLIVPFDLFNVSEYGEVVNKSLHITSEKPISVYAENYQICSCDASLILPTTACGSYYIIQNNVSRTESTKYNFQPSVFNITAFEDDTEVEITPTLTTSDNRPANVPFTITLNKGDVYQVCNQKDDMGKGLSGSQVRALNGKKVAVFAGNRNSNVPDECYEGDADILYDVSYPVSSWGKIFVIRPFSGGNYDLIKCTASKDDTKIYKNGTLLAVINAFESYEFVVDEKDGAFKLETSEPTSVYQYMTSTFYKTRRSDGGPSYQYVAPVEQAIENITFSTMSNALVLTHYLNLVIKTTDVETITLNGRTGFATFTPVDDVYSSASVALEDGQYTLNAANGFVANIYGTGKDISYSYSAGSEIKKLNIEPFDCTSGTILFRESFGGDFVSEPVVGPALPSSSAITLKNSTGGMPGYNGYLITKTAVVRRQNGSYPPHVYAGWYADFGDHTYPDDMTRGYFMQVDLESTAQTFYKVRVDGLCENTNLYFSFYGRPANYRVDAPIDLSIMDVDGNVLKKGLFTIDCNKNEWQQFGIPFTVPLGTTSIVYSVFSSAGSNGGDFCLDDIEIRLCTPPVEVNSPEDSLCIGSNYAMKAKMNDVGSLIEPITYTWYKNDTKNYNNEGWTKVGTGNEFSLKNVTKKDEGYYKVIATSVGVEGEYSMCGSFSDIFPVMAKECKVDTVIYDTICPGTTYTFEGEELTASGAYEKTLKNIDGSDSTVILELTVLDSIHTELKDTVCSGPSYLFGTQLLTQSGIYTETFTSVSGCDSIVTLDLTINKSYYVELSDTIFEGETYQFGNLLLSESGVYKDGFIAVTGCDSTVNLELTVIPNALAACDNGTILFKEDFGGNYVTDPVLGPKLPSGSTTLPFSEHVWEWLKNGYDIRKEAIRRRDYNPQNHIYAGWYADFGDHTYDGDLTRGYFMIIDLDNQEATFYKVRVDNLCENTQLNFSFWGHPLNASESAPITLTIEDINGKVISEEKFIIDCHNNEWQQFSLPFFIPAGQTSIVYKVFSGAGSDGGDFALDDIEIRLCTPPVDVEFPADSLCIGSDFTLKASMSDKGSLVEPINYTWYKNTEKNYNNEGWVKIATGNELPLRNITKNEEGYYKVFATSNGTSSEYNMCSSFSDIVSVRVKSCTEEIVKRDTIRETICYASSYIFDGEELEKSGTYEKTYKDEQGNDSIVTLELTVLDRIVTELFDTIYIDEEYNKNGFVITTPVLGPNNIYRQILQSESGCDSSVALRLNVICRTNYTDLYDTIYAGAIYDANGFYITDTPIGISSYSLQYSNRYGCDSIVTLNLNVQDPVEYCSPSVITYDVAICAGEAYEFKGLTYNTTGTYMKTYATTEGCDSLIILNLTVFEPSVTELSAEIYQNEKFDGYGFHLDPINELGLHRFDTIYQSVVGCDSTVILYLNVKEPVVELMIPTAFTPYTGDGLNDVFMPGYEVYIYDRYGNLMTHSSNGWDGSYRGETATPGVYMYVLITNTGDKYKGTIEIVKSK